DRSANGTIHAEIQYLDAATRAGFDPQALSVELDGAPATGVMVRDDGFITLDATGLGKQKHRIIVRAADRAGHKATDLYLPFWIEDEDFDFRDGLLYFVFTDRFQNGDRSNDDPTPGVDPRPTYHAADFTDVNQTIYAAS